MFNSEVTYRRLFVSPTLTPTLTILIIAKYLLSNILTTHSSHNILHKSYIVNQVKAHFMNWWLPIIIFWPLLSNMLYSNNKMPRVVIVQCETQTPLLSFLQMFTLQLIKSALPYYRSLESQLLSSWYWWAIVTTRLISSSAAMHHNWHITMIE